MDIDNSENHLYKLTALYLALLDTNNPTQEQLDLLAEHQFIKTPMQLVKPETVIAKQNIITERSGFLHYLSKQITKSLDSKLVAFNSPYQIDNKLGIESETGLTQKWPMNTTVALVKITEDESHVGYMAVSSHEHTAAIIKDKATGKAEIHLHGRTKNPDIRDFISHFELASNANPTREGVYVNKSIAEKNAVFEVKTGYPSLNDFFKTKFPKETSEIENFDQVIDRLVNKGTVASVSGLKSGDVTADKFKLACQLQNLILKIYNSDSVNVHEAAAVEDLFTFNSDKHAKDLASCFNIDTTAIRQLPSETMNKLDIEPLEISFFQTADNTLFVVSQNGINMYKPDEAIQELHGMNNDEHTFQIARMMYVGQSTVTTALNNETKGENMKKDAEKKEAIDELRSRFNVHNYDDFIYELIKSSGTFKHIGYDELADGLKAGKATYEIVNEHYKNITPETMYEYINYLNRALMFNKRMLANTQEEVLVLLEKGYGLCVAKVKQYSECDDGLLKIIDEQNIKFFCGKNKPCLLVQIDGVLVNCINSKSTLPNQEFTFNGETFENTPNLFEVMHWQFIGDFDITTNYESSVSTPAAEQHIELKNSIIEEMNHHLETLNEFIEEHYPAAVIIAPPALAEFVDDMAGYSFVHSNQEFDGVEFVDIWNHYEDHYKRSPTPLLLAVMEDLSENHDTRAYDLERTLERALNMVEGVEPEPEPEPETPKAKSRNKMKI